MNVLVINCGSSSLKYQLFDMTNESVLAKGLVERIGLEGAKLSHRPAKKDKYEVETEIPNHEKAIELVLKALVDSEHGVIDSMEKINAIGHRVVHGGEDFSGSVFIDEKVMKALNDNISLAPLHNPPNIMGIEACKKLMPNVPQVGVFDTAFHQTIPKHAFLYGIPYEYYQKYKIRKYGFHGTSHKYVAQRAAAMLRTPLEKLKLITCHLGNGASICAVEGGKSVETSMGFTPLEGLMMGTRSGDIDPAIVSYLMEKEGWSMEEATDFFNKRCGVLGISGVSSDFRDIESAADEGNERAQLALERFAHMVKKYIGSYVAIMNGVDAIVFTAGLGENSAEMRYEICKSLTYLGLEIDRDKNFTRGVEADVSTDDSKVRVLVIPTNEELMIARDTYDIVTKL
ncbi:MAG: acetate kinase [Clostridia bacterium]|jgi:acetate kinase|nr:acetate kinase [Clostridia bacterium]MDN5324125.1 acetate kinase [Clostridia bacterium]